MMATGDMAALGAGTYSCAIDPEVSSPDCASSKNMLMSANLAGTIKCHEDNSSCVLDAGTVRRIASGKGTGDGALIYRSLVFQNGLGYAPGGGALVLFGGAGENYCSIGNYLIKGEELTKED